MFLLCIWVVVVSYSFSMGKWRTVPEPETRASHAVCDAAVILIPKA